MLCCRAAALVQRVKKVAAAEFVRAATVRPPPALRRAAADAAIQPLLNLVGGSNAASYGGSISRSFYGTTQHDPYLAWRESLNGSAAALVYAMWSTMFDAVGFNFDIALASRLVPRSACGNGGAASSGG